MATKLNSLNDLLEHEVKDLYNAEQQLIKALPKMAAAASNESLKRAFEEHLEETKQQKERLEKVAEICGFKPTGETCAAMAGLVKEGEDMMKIKGEDPVKDAGLIACAQRIEHYEIAGYGTAHKFAQQLKMKDAAKLLADTLKEEKAADEKLNKIAIDSINLEAKKTKA